MKIIAIIIQRNRSTAITADTAIPAMILPLRLESAGMVEDGISVTEDISITIDENTFANLSINNI